MTASQEAPAARADLSRFPEITVPANLRLYRSHSAAHGAWYFDASHAGRFNLHGARGTCYAASSIDTAVREKVRGRASRTGVVSRALAGSFVLSVVSPPHALRCAAVNDKSAATHGIVRELTTMKEYAVPQAWARAFDEAGFDGVVYGSAFTTGDPDAYAVFGAAGEPSPGAGHKATLFMTGEEACAELGWTVPRTPVTGDMTVI